MKDVFQLFCVISDLATWTTYMNLSSSGDTCSTAELSENDIPGASLTEPLEAHNVAALKWWLLCRGIKVKSSSRKKEIIERIREAMRSGAKVIDVDGSYVARKRQLQCEIINEPTGLVTDIGLPITGWEVISAENYKSYSCKMPTVTLGQ